MRLVKLTLENFQGIKDFTLTASGKNVNVYSDNGLGKTTIFNSITWLLFDKASTGEKGYSPKTKGPDGEDVHFLTHSVTGTFVLEDGLIIRFCKQIKEDWRKTSGSNEKTFKGNPRTYFIDDVPVSERDYLDRLNCICPTEQAKMLTMPFYFGDVMEWGKRRKIVIDICGDVSDTDVIASDVSLKELPVILAKPGTTNQFYTVEEYIVLAKSKQTKLKEEKDSIPDRIDEATKAIPVTSLKIEDVELLVKNLQAKRVEKEQDKLNLANTDASKVLQGQISDLQLQLSNARNKHASNYNESVKVLNDDVATWQNNITNISSEVYGMESSLTTLRDKLLDMGIRRKDLSEKYTEYKSREWDGDTKCPYCGSDIPIEKIEETKAKFNTEKSNMLETTRLQVEKECSKPMIADLENQIAEKLKMVLAKQKELEDSKEFLVHKKSEVPVEVPFETTDEYVEITGNITETRYLITEGSSDTSSKSFEIQNEIDSIDIQIEKALEDKSKIQGISTQKARITDLKAKEKVISQEEQKIEKNVYLCQCFTRAKVSMLDEKINSKFENLKFRLSVTQVNGDLKDDCEVLIPTDVGDIPYASANNGARITAGLEIINTLNEYWDVSLPVVIDNSEGVNRLGDVKSQMIRLVVELRERICLECGHVWMPTIGDETTFANCPACKGKKVDIKNKKLRVEVEG